MTKSIPKATSLTSLNLLLNIDIFCPHFGGTSEEPSAKGKTFLQNILKKLSKVLLFHNLMQHAATATD